MSLPKNFIDQQGQATTEYILLLCVIVSIFLLFMAGMSKYKIADMLTAPLQKQFAATYRYGNSKAKGYDDGGPVFHPRAVGGAGSNFRLFLNPKEGS